MLVGEKYSTKQQPMSTFYKLNTTNTSHNSYMAKNNMKLYVTIQYLSNHKINKLRFLDKKP